MASHENVRRSKSARLEDHLSQVISVLSICFWSSHACLNERAQLGKRCRAFGLRLLGPEAEEKRAEIPVDRFLRDAGEVAQ